MPEELPDLIDLSYISKMNPAQAGVQAVAHTVNKLIYYLREKEVESNVSKET